MRVIITLHLDQKEYVVIFLYLWQCNGSSMSEISFNFSYYEWYWASFLYVVFIIVVIVCSYLLFISPTGSFFKKKMFKRSLYIKYISPLSMFQISDNFFQFIICLLTWLNGNFWPHELLNFYVVKFIKLNL